jgi:hypothetical protein
MNFVVAPPNQRNGGVPEGDEVDQVLRAFFKAQVPDPWPSFESPPETSILPFVPPARRSSGLRGRLALAASVAILAAGGWLLPGKFAAQPADVAVEPTHTPGIATPPRPGVEHPLPHGYKLNAPSIFVTPDGPTEIKTVIERTPDPQP